MKIDELKSNLRVQQQWIKVHAAEFLIWENQEVEFVKQTYINELTRYETVPQYRIGIWRVLYQTSSAAAERARYLHKIVGAFHTDVDSLHALETLAKLKQPVTAVAPKFADQTFHAESITPFEIYGLWNLYHDVKMDKTKIIKRLLAVLADPKQADQHKMLVAYVFRFIEISRNTQDSVLQVDLDRLAKAVRLQLLASILINFDLNDTQYAKYKRKLLALAPESDYYPVAIRALAAKGILGNTPQVDSYAALLADTSGIAYDVDDHSTANYAWLMHHRLVGY